MSYEPTNWKSGDTVTSAKLNKMEQGIANAGGIFFINGTIDEATQTITLDKTWQEIYDADFPIILTDDVGYKRFLFVEEVVDDSGDSGSYLVNCFVSASTMRFSTESASGYPVFVHG